MRKQTFPYEDLIFENRNKQYGAYELRINYHSNLMRSFFIGIGGLTLLVFIIYKIVYVNDSATVKPKFDDKVNLDNIFTAQKIDIEQPKPIQGTLNPNPPRVIEPVVDPNAFRAVTRIPEPVEPLPSQPIPVEPLPVGPGGGGEPIAGPAVSGPSEIPGLPSVFSSAVVDKLPEFPGGMEGFYKFLSKNIKFPEMARNEGISGKVYVSFVIDKDGKLTKIEFMKRVGYGMEESVSTVLEKSPKWTPGFMKNQEVNTQMILPVSFDFIQ